jgi:uncharacterized protein (DUF433 family)
MRWPSAYRRSPRRPPASTTGTFVATWRVTHRDVVAGGRSAFSPWLAPANPDVDPIEYTFELAVVGFYRAEGVSMPVVRAARTRAQQLFGTEYPFATKRLRTDGSGVFADLADAVPNDRLQIELSKSQVTYRELVEPFFRENLDFGQDELALTYWPLGREKPVLLDARRSFGQPIVMRTGTPTFVLFQMCQSGETLERIALWYGLTHEELNSALAYEEQLRTAA